MVYANVVLAAGLEEYARRAAAAGASGLIVPDLPHDETAELRAACDAHGLALVPLVAPTTTPERVEAIGADARGFVYTVSLTGHHRRARRAAAGLTDTVERVRGATAVPVAVGFGISTAEQRRCGGRARRRRDRGQPRGARGRRRRARGGGRARLGARRRRLR